jgi:GAF domain-containing protein
VACQGIVANEQPTLVENTLEDPRWPARPRDINRGFSRSASGVPLREGDYVVGVLTLARDNLPFTDEDLAVLAGVVAPVEELVLTSHAR